MRFKINTIEQAVVVLNERKWRERDDWRVAGETGAWSSHNTPEFYDPIEYDNLAALAIANSLVLADELEVVEAKNERLTDLVRHQRHALHGEGLITNGEYVALLEEPNSVKWLEGYDAVRRQIAKLQCRWQLAADQDEVKENKS